MIIKTSSNNRYDKKASVVKMVMEKGNQLEQFLRLYDRQLSQR
ncbi:MAG: hypothetical protein PHR70_09145 [Tissierellia bacterium]|nr:hypothetical protein [Tissierellia bacterium]